MLTEKLARTLEEIVTDRVHVHAESERTYQVLDLMKNERFWRGYHYSLPIQRNGLWEFQTMDRALSGQQNKPYDYVLNYYYGDGQKLIGLLGKTPNAKAVADDRNDVNNRRTGKADEILRNLYAQWDTETLSSELMLGLWKNGVMFGYTPFIANSRRFGMTKVPAKVEKRPVMVSEAQFHCFRCGAITPEEQGTATGACPACGQPFSPEMLFPAEYIDVPEIVEYTEFSNGTVELHLCSAYTVTTPFWIKSLSDSPWLQYEYEEHRGKLLRTFPELRGKSLLDLSGGSGGNAGDYAAQARGRAQSPYFEGTPRMDLARFTRFWMEPEMYEMIDNAAERDGLNRDYPEGARVSLVSGKVVHVFPESHREVWRACKPSVSEYLYAQPLGNPYRELNRLINNAHNIMSQTAERGIPIQLFDVNLISKEALTRNPASVMDWLPVLPPMGGDLRQAVYHTPAAELSQSVVQMAATSLDAARQCVNMLPPLFGQSGPGEQTLGQVEIERNQALLPHNITWNYMRQFFGGCFENAIRQHAKHSPGDIHFTSSTSNGIKAIKMEDAADILAGGWHVEVEQNIPLTHGQKRAQNWRLLELNPEVASKVGVFDPQNIAAMYDTLGNGDLKVPGMNGREKALEVIAELLEGEAMEVQTGDPMMPVKMLPSIPADEFEDDHMLMATVVKEWSQTRTGRLHKKLRGGRGYDNVIAWGMAHLEMVNAAMGPPEVGAGPQNGPPPKLSGQMKPLPMGESPEGLTPQPEEMAGVTLEGI